MQPGEFNHYVEVQIEDVVQATDGSGDRIEGFRTVFEVYADMQGVSIRDFIAARSEQVVISHKFKIRFDDIPPNTNWLLYRLKCDDLYYRISGVLPDNKGGREWITLACESGTTVWQTQE